ncbi:hypothetical protein E2C01_101605 [Portunus trituberculatus]|uniref:Uncharacterized protein n=1 Tax=Portunus trituberculatus TaxID=210409 RepID=A0A5B7KG53_PORTR|nr:hypothetical protein [Portunus trituberculatus]
MSRCGNGREDEEEEGAINSLRSRVNPLSEAANGTDADHGSFQPLGLEKEAAYTDSHVHPTHHHLPLRPETMLCDGLLWCWGLSTTFYRI